ncbi:MAG TPA: hypothetical protein VK726_11990 [Acetobacteraceae bacterium]|jgi:SHS family lactate transporter-like MFS transporter|nr:hypothetical protein [Acetobacteraceae bacterium]
MIIPAVIAIAVAPVYLLTSDITWIVLGFVVQGAFGGGIYAQNPSCLAERVPTEVRATASAFCYHQGAIWGGFMAPVLVYFPSSYDVSLAIPMLAGTVGGMISFTVAVLCGPETRGKELVPDLVVS